MGTLSRDQSEAIRREVFNETQIAYERAGFKARKIAKELAVIAFSDIKNYLSVNDDGTLKINTLDTLKKNQSHAIKKIRERSVSVVSAKGEAISTTSTVEFELYDKLKAIEMGAEYAGLKPAAHVKVGGDPNNPIRMTNLSDDELIRIATGGGRGADPA